MSKHFLNGNTYGPYVDAGPGGTIIVDPTARVLSNDPFLDAMDLGGGGWNITISGLVFSYGRAIFLGDASAVVSNIKINAGAEIFGGSFGILANHATNIVNAGRISSKTNSAGIWENNGGDFTISNLKAGVIEGGGVGILADGLGIHTITNAGIIASFGGGAAIVGDDGIEKVTNWGRIEGPPFIGGGAHLGGGNDIFTNFKKVGGVIKHGIVTGIIELGVGDDIFRGGKRAEKVRDDEGTDSYNFGGGNDTYFAVYVSSSPSGDGADIVNGGAGTDTYNAASLGNNGFITVNLDSVLHSGVDPHSVRLSAGGSAIGIDTVAGIEAFIGTDGFDIFWGSKGADIFDGGKAQDTIIGLGGADFLVGGADVDSFLYTSLKDSGPTKATRDTIADFDGAGIAGGDLIDLQSLNDNDNFHFIGNNVAFDGSLGAIRAVNANNQTVVSLDVDGDMVADFSIALGNLSLAIVDFQL